MGDSYGFCKVRKDKFVSGKSRFIRDPSGLWIEDDNPDYSFIVNDLDREDFLYSLVKPENGYLDSLDDPELAGFIKDVYKSDDEQAMVVTRKSVQHAIDVLTDLDRRVKSMPCDKKSEANVIHKRYLETGKWKYVEDRPNDGDGVARVYVSSCKENVDIYKEVEKVYRHRAYHYGFPWIQNGGEGASWLVDFLTDVVNEMDNPSNKDYVFLFTWI